MTSQHPAQESLREVIRSGQAGNWKLTENLGRGGQGTTFRAVWTKEAASLTRIALGGEHQQRSVVKLMIPPDPTDYPIPSAKFEQLLDHLVNEFIAECMVLDSLDNPYIPDFYQASRQSAKAGWAVPWFAVELIEGRSLAAQRKIAGPLDQNQLLELAHDMLSALSALHAAGLVHLDLKPDNVMLEPGKSRLIDFGLATQANRVQPGISGTPGFFTPEQLDQVVEERDFAPEVDLFKLGVTLAWASGIDLPDLWQADPFGPTPTLLTAMKRGAHLGALKPAVREVIAPLLSFEPARRGSAAMALEQVRALLPPGSSRSSAKETGGSAKPASRPQPASPKPARPRAAATPPPKPQRQVGGREANVGARVVVVDRLGLDWAGVVVGADSKRPGNILVRHESTRGNENVRSYPLEQVVRGSPLK
ncbi:protein kinase domain-containing protein [Agromyces sp. SYSU T00194]|uniref:protein kinase domain-containing protein n=1 Tax=Agromyces chitinivorans TaxID=3158560 RepID=UPI0033970F26